MNPGSGGRLSGSQHSSPITPHRGGWGPRHLPQKEADEPGLGPVLPQKSHPSPDLVLAAESNVDFCRCLLRMSQMVWELGMESSTHSHPCLPCPSLEG